MKGSMTKFTFHRHIKSSQLGRQNGRGLFLAHSITARSVGEHLHLVGVLWQIQRHLSQSTIGTIHRIGLALTESGARQCGRIATGAFADRTGRFVALSATGHMEEEQDENPQEEKGSHFVRKQDALPPQRSLRCPR